MQYVARLVGNVTILELRGALVGYDAPAVTSRVEEAIRAGCSKVVVLMGAVTAIEQAGLEALVAARTMLLRQRGDLRLVMPPAYLTERIGEWLGPCSSELEAVLSFWPRATGRHAQLVGYWANEEEPSKYPAPRHLVNLQWRREDRDRILDYLRSGSAQSGYGGHSACWFGCGPCGGNELTDGVWIWPEGLAHYVEAHAVVLPDEFVAAMAANRWSAPRRFADGAPSVAFWVEWASREGFTPSQFADCLDAGRRIDELLDQADLETLAALSAAQSDHLQHVMELARTLEAPAAVVGPAQVQAALIDAQPALAQLSGLRPPRVSTVSVFSPRVS